MKESPFIYGSTVSTAGFTNRESETARLKGNLLGGINTILISPRRWGKSSLVEKVILDIRKSHKTKVKVVMIDLFAVGSEEAFLELYAREVIKASSARWQDWLKSGQQLFSQIVPKLSVGLDPMNDFSLSFDRKELKKNSQEILNLPEKISTQKDIRFIICLDEFQNLASFPNFGELEKKMRSNWQRHKRVTYCLYGSKRHMMSDIFNNSSKPFYRFGDLMLLQKIESARWVSFICSSFEETGKQINPETAGLISGSMKNHSWYVQQLSHYVWNMTGRKAGTKEVESALNELINANSPLYQREVEYISTTQLNLLKAIAAGQTQLTSQAVMQDYQLGTPNNVLKNKAILMQQDIIQEMDKKYEFLDPAFELWFRRVYFNQPYLPG